MLTSVLKVTASGATLSSCMAVNSLSTASVSPRCANAWRRVLNEHASGGVPEEEGEEEGEETPVLGRVRVTHSTHHSTHHSTPHSTAYSTGQAFFSSLHTGLVLTHDLEQLHRFAEITRLAEVAEKGVVDDVVRLAPAQFLTSPRGVRLALPDY